MRLTALFGGADSDDDRAVSPVIGVILMVAIVVILAAVVGTFVLGLAEQAGDAPPQASIGFDYDPGASGADCSLGSSGVLTVTHTGGDSLDPMALTVTDGGSSEPWDDNGGGCSAASGTVMTGSAATYGVDAGDTVRVVWASGDGDSAPLGTWEGPDA